MVRKTKKAPVRMTPAQRKAKAAIRKVAKKKAAKKRVASKRPSAIRALENAIEVGIADLDGVAVSLGLLGAVEPPPAKKRRK